MPKKSTTTTTPTPVAKQNMENVVTEISLRDYFAAKAMQAYITAIYNMDSDELAKSAYSMADTMLLHRETP